MLSLNRKYHRAYNRTRDGNFSLSGLIGFDFYGKTAGVIGTGKIGKALISILSGFGMKLLAYDIYPDAEFAKAHNLIYTDIDTLFNRCDIISLNAPLTRETYHIINEGSIAKMKDGVMIINTGRGGLIDTQSLINGLKDKKVGFAGLDVYEEEEKYFFEDLSASMIEDDVLARLLTFNNVIITSHQGFFTREALTNIAEITLHNIREYLDTGKCNNEVKY
jgi:D-lactate dehydrogenase